MAAIAEWLKIAGEQVAESIQNVRNKLSGAEGELVLDFSTVRHIDTEALRALDELAVLADERSVKIVLRGINVDVYRVLKVSRLTSRFRFVV